jgi:hypothetical protein
MDVCSQCPHPNDCLKVGACLDHLNAPLIASGQFPRRMTPAQANEFMAALRAGRSLRRISGGLKKFGPAIASPKKFRTHCELYPTWGAEALRLAAANAKAADILKGLPRRRLTHCFKGHPFTEGLPYRDERHRRCTICASARAKLGGVLTRLQLNKIKAALDEGTPISHFTGGGRPGYIVKHRTFLRYRNEHPEFNIFVLEAMKDNNSRGQKQRFQLQRMVSGGRIQQVNDFHSIAAMVPRDLPADMRDEIVQSVFLAILEKRLRFDDVSKRIREFVTAHNRMFPTKFAKFGDSPLISLDEVTFEDGTATRSDSVSRGLWD